MTVRRKKNVWRIEQNRNGFSDRQVKTNAFRYLASSVRIARELDAIGHDGAVAYWTAAFGFAEVWAS